MLENAAIRWVAAVLALLAVIGLLGYVRGDSSDSGRSPEREESLPALIHDRFASLPVGV